MSLLCPYLYMSLEMYTVIYDIIYVQLICHRKWWSTMRSFFPHHFRRPPSWEPNCFMSGWAKCWAIFLGPGGMNRAEQWGFNGILLGVYWGGWEDRFISADEVKTIRNFTELFRTFAGPQLHLCFGCSHWRAGLYWTADGHQNQTLLGGKLSWLGEWKWQHQSTLKVEFKVINVTAMVSVPWYVCYLRIDVYCHGCPFLNVS